MKKNNGSPKTIKYNLIERLPEAFIQNKEAMLGGFLSSKERIALATTSKTNYRLFYTQPIGARLTEKLLYFVARGREDEARKILECCPELLLNRGKLTDYSMRSFYEISAFQYALWALDTAMQRMIISMIPMGAEGHTLWAELIRQDESLEVDGVTYTLEDETYCNQHYFDFEIITRPLEYYVHNFKSWDNESPRNSAAIDDALRRLARAQRLVPVNVANEYCHPTRSFYPTPVFNEPAPRVTNFTSYATGAKLDWWPPASARFSCGFDSDILRAGGLVALVGAPSSRERDLDLSAMIALRESRHADLNQTREILNKGRDQVLDSTYVIT